MVNIYGLCFHGIYNLEKVNSNKQLRYQLWTVLSAMKGDWGWEAMGWRRVSLEACLREVTSHPVNVKKEKSYDKIWAKNKPVKGNSQSSDCKGEELTTQEKLKACISKIYLLRERLYVTKWERWGHGGDWVEKRLQEGKSIMGDLLTWSTDK